MLNQKSKQKNKRGFTLIEILLYISMVSIIVLSISSFFVLIQRVKIKNQVITNVNNQGLFISGILDRTIRETSSIDEPSTGQSSNLLRLMNADGSFVEEKVEDGNFKMLNYDTNGNLQKQNLFSDDSVSIIGEGDLSFVLKWGSQGKNDGEFHSPFGVALNSHGDIYVADSSNNRVQKFNSDGTYLSQFGSTGSGDGEFQKPFGIAIDTSGNVYVTDMGNNRIQKFNSDGTYISQFGSTGSGDGEFQVPVGIAIDTSGNVYVTDVENNRIQKFNSDGTYLSQFGSQGSGDGEFQMPFGIALNTSGDIYVADSSNNRIQKFSPSIFSVTANGDPFVSYNFSVKARSTTNNYEYNYIKNFSGGATLRNIQNQ